MPSDPTAIFEAATAFWRSAALFAACDLGVFDGLAEGPATAPELAERLGASERGVGELLDSCVSLSLVDKEGSAYRNSATASDYLTSASPDSLLSAMSLQAHTFPLWDKLPEAVREGKPVMQPSSMVGGNAEFTRHLIVGMHQRARMMARCLVENVDFSGRSVLADIGGGGGSFSIVLGKEFPELTARVMDLAPVLEIAKELIAESGVDDRVTTVPCDVTKDDFGSGYDAALVSGLLHRMDPEQCRAILGKVFKGLDAGGLVVVNDLFGTDEAPAMAVLFGLQMLLTVDHGVTHAATDVSGWLQDCGFVNVRMKALPPPHPHTLVIADKP
jgi:predicted O-methyltransferase YrrM